MAPTALIAGITSATFAVTLTNAGSSPAQAGADHDAAEQRTIGRTHALLAALERKDLPSIIAVTDPRVTLTMPLSFSGAQEPSAHFVGKAQVLGYIESVFTNMAITFCKTFGHPDCSPESPMNSIPRGEIVLRAVLVVIGVITTLPALALVDASALDSGYGVTDPDPMTLALLQHRGMFQLLLGAAIVWAAFHRSARLAVAIGAVISKCTFLFLTLSNDATRGDIPLYTVAFDGTCIIVLTTLAISELRTWQSSGKRRGRCPRTAPDAHRSDRSAPRLRRGRDAFDN